MANSTKAKQPAPSASAYSGLAILTVVVACNLVGDGLRSAFDPRMRVDG